MSATWSIDRQANRYAILTGAGFSESRLALDRIAIELAGGDSPKVCFVPTASGDSASYIDRFHDAFADIPSVPTHLPLFRRGVVDPASLLADQDVIYVGGGNTANMLAVWRLHGIDTILLDAYRAGTILMGISAGAACLFNACLTDSFGELAPLHDGLTVLPGSFCPHYRSEPGRRDLLLSLIASGELASGFALDDNTMAVFENEQLKYVISEDDNATIWSIEKGAGDAAVETPIRDDRYTFINLEEH